MKLTNLLLPNFYHFESINKTGIKYFNMKIGGLIALYNLFMAEKKEPFQISDLNHLELQGQPTILIWK